MWHVSKPVKNRRVDTKYKHVAAPRRRKSGWASVLDSIVLADREIRFNGEPIDFAISDFDVPEVELLARRPMLIQVKLPILTKQLSFGDGVERTPHGSYGRPAIE